MTTEFSAPLSRLSSLVFRNKLGTASAVILLVLAWLFLCRPWFLGGRTVPWDSKDQFYPAAYFASQSLRAGDSPLWNPHIYAGYPTGSDPSGMIFSPLTLGLMIVVDKPSFRWFDGIELLHLLLGALGMLVLCVRLGRTPLGGLFAALVYMFGGSAAARMEHVPMTYAYGYFPLALFALHEALESKRLRWAVAFGVLAGIMAAHENQVAYLFSLVLIAYVFYFAACSESFWRFFAARWKMLATATVAGMATLAVPFFLTLQFVSLSNRPQIAYETAAWASLHPLTFLTLFVRNFFGNSGLYYYWGFNDITESYLYAGMIPAVLILRYGIPTGALFERQFRFFLGVGIFSFLYAIGSFTPFYWLVYHILPGVSLYRRPSDATFVINMALAMATAFLIDKLLSGSPGRVKLPLALLESSGLIAFLAWGMHYAAQKDKIASVLKQLWLTVLYAAIALVLLYAITRMRKEKIRGALVFAALFLLAVDLGVYNAGSRLNAHDPEPLAVLEQARRGTNALGQFLSSSLDVEHQAGGPYRAEIINAGSLWTNAPMMFGFDSTQGYDPLRYGLYEKTAGAQEMGGLPRPFPPMMPSYVSPLFDMLSVKYIASAEELVKIDPRADQQHFPRVYDREGLGAWINPRVLPRVLTPTTIQLDPDLTAAITTGKMAPFDYRSVVVLEHLPSTLASAGALPGQGDSTARVASYRNTEVVVEVQSARDVILVLNDLYYPYWRVYVDGKRRELLQANYLFRGVHVKAGERLVVFRFEPLSWPAIRGTLERLSKRKG